ncbi:MAG: hypothetical protein CMA29_04185 [Euryarchaeota archaeon]|nr:hypothetical protein [Euryarchaeota archaeon]
MSWKQVLADAGLNEREIQSILILSSKPKMKASELASELGTTRLDAYNSLSRLQEIGLVTTTADRPMKFSSPPVNEAVEQLIGMKKEQLRRVEIGYESVLEGRTIEGSNIKEARSDEPKFAVLKERVHIHKRIEQMAEEAQTRMVLMLGEYGILALCRGPAVEAVNSAVKRGVRVQVLAKLHRRTVRFFEQLDDAVEVRHSDDVETQGALKDETEVLQMLKIEANPVGRGREDAALYVLSEQFAASQANLIDAIWPEAVPFEQAVKRFTEKQIVDPLRIEIGQGSFLEKLRNALGVDLELPDEDTPFDPDAMIKAGREVSNARRSLSENSLASLTILGFDLQMMMRQVGRRVGEELAFTLRSIEDNIEFLNEMMDLWEAAGLGTLAYEFDPNFHVRVGLNELPETDNPEVLPLWELDDGIIEGALAARYPDEGDVRVVREEGSGDIDDLWRYHLLMQEDTEMTAEV